MVIKVAAHPNSKRPRVEKRDSVFHVHVAAPATDGRANRAVVDALAVYFDVPKFEVELKSGHTSKIKLFEIHEA